MASLADVAAQVGVSQSTASRALNRPEMVAPDVVARVREAAQALRYVPNPFARSLRVKASKTLGLIVPDSTNPFFAEVARGIEAACFRAGYTLILCNSDRSLELEAQQARVLTEKRVDGILLFNASDASAPTIASLRAQRLPVVLIERRPPAALDDVDCVVSDNAAGVRQAIAHLASLGHRRVACLIGALDAWHYVERLGAYLESTRELGLTTDGALVRTGLVTFADGQRGAEDLLSQPVPPTALFCGTDTLAIGALRGAARLARRVPADVAVVGFGNTDVTAYTQPPLTCVGQDKLTVGALAVRVLLHAIARSESRSPSGSTGAAAAPELADHPHPQPHTHIVPTRLVVRESTVASVASAVAPAPVVEYR